MSCITPIFRMFDENKAKEFYIDFLGFTVDWEHRFDPSAPLYMQVSKGDFVIHLSEHHGDGTPGSAIRLEIEDLEDYHKKITGKNYKYYRPGIMKTSWGTAEMSVQDPFGNKLVFFREL